MAAGSSVGAAGQMRAVPRRIAIKAHVGKDLKNLKRITIEVLPEKVRAQAKHCQK
jgi:hypothetical protein